MQKELTIKGISRQFRVNTNRAKTILSVIKSAIKAQKVSAYTAEKSFKCKSLGVPSSVTIAVSFFASRMASKPIDFENNFLLLKSHQIIFSTGCAVVRKTAKFNYVSKYRDRYHFPVFAGVLDCFINFANYVSTNKIFKKCFLRENPLDFWDEYVKSLRFRLSRKFISSVPSLINRYGLVDFDLRKEEIWGDEYEDRSEDDWFSDDCKKRREVYRAMLEKC